MAYSPSKFPYSVCIQCGAHRMTYVATQLCTKCTEADTKPMTFRDFNYQTNAHIQSVAAAEQGALAAVTMAKAALLDVSGVNLGKALSVDFAKAEEKVFASMTPSEQLLYTPPQHEVHDAFAWPTTKIVSTKVVPLTHTELFTNQRFIMRVGMLSNCNITVQQFVKPDQVTAAYRLFCTNCRDALLISDYKTLNGQMTEVWISNAEAFCTAHKHETQVTQTVATGVSLEIRAGRKYRDE